MISGCSTIASGQPKALSSRNGQVQITVPSSWKIQDLHDDPDIQVANTWDENYLILLSENKADFEEVTLSEHSDLTRQILLENVENVQTRRGPNCIENQWSTRRTVRNPRIGR